MNGWLWAATVLGGLLVPLVLVAAFGHAHSGLVAVEAAGVDAALAMLLLAEGTQSQSFATLAVITAFVSFVGSIGYIRFLGELEHAKGGG
jgi:multisubunit Na+/H+ antiporter MnhF subunit